VLPLRFHLSLALQQSLLRAQQPFELGLRDVPKLQQDIAQPLGRSQVVLGLQGFEELLLADELRRNRNPP